MSALSKESWICLSTSVLKLLYQVVLVDGREENPASGYAARKRRLILFPQGPQGSLNTLRTTGAEIQNILVPEETNYLKMFPTLDFSLEYKTLSMVSVWLNDGVMPFYEISGLLHT